MDGKTFKVGDRVTHPKLGHSGKVIYLYTKTRENAPGTEVQVYRIVFDNYLSTIDAYADELEHERK